MKDLYNRHPERYLDPYEDKKYNLPHQVVAFKGEGGKVRIEASYALPVDQLHYRRVGDHYAVDVDQGTFLLDNALVEVSRKVVSDATPRPVSLDPRGSIYTVDEARWTVSPGRYTAVVEVKDNQSGRIGQLRREVDGRRFAAPGLCLSDILLARDIRRIGQEESSWTSFAVIPNPLRIYRAADDLAVYFEVAYTLSLPQASEIDLRLFPELGGTPKEMAKPKTPVRSVVYRPGIDPWSGPGDFFRTPADDGHVVEYRVEYQAEAREEQKLTPELQRQLGLGKKYFSTTVTLHYEGYRTEEPRALRIDVRQTPMGLQKLTLTVKDLHTGAQVSGWTLVRVVE
jgi:hypothetical protein